MASVSIRWAAQQAAARDCTSEVFSEIGFSSCGKLYAISSSAAREPQALAGKSFQQRGVKMSKEQVLSLLKETAEMRGMIDQVNEAERLGKMFGRPDSLLQIMSGLSGDELEQAVEVARNAIPKLKSALLELSPQEAKEVMQIALVNDDYNNTLARVNVHKSTTWSERIKLSKLIFPAQADRVVSSALQKMIDAGNAPEKHIMGISPSEVESEDFKKFRAELDKILLFYIPLKGLYEEKVISDEVAGLALDAFHFRKAEDMENLSKALAYIITQVDGLDILENVARIWREVIPASLNTKLTKMYLGTSDPKVKENIKNTIVLMGKDPLQFIQGEDIIMSGGKKNIIKGNVGGIITVDSSMVILKDIKQTIHNSPNIDQSTKSELEELIERLNKELEQVPEENAEEAKKVAERTKQLVDAANEAEPDKKFLDISAERLLKAAENIAKVVPVVSVVVDIAKQIVKLLVG